MNDNSVPISDCESESGSHEYKHGHYYDGNLTKKADIMWGEGSEGLAQDQGAIRVSIIPDTEELKMMQDNTTRFKTQGSDAHMKEAI